MIVTIKATKAGMSKAYLESIKYGLEFEPYSDGTFDLTVHRDDQLDRIVSSCGGEVVAKQEHTSISPYGGE